MVRLEIVRASEYGQGDRTFMVNTHLGEFITYNDTVLGYDLDQMTLQDLDEYVNDSKRNKHELPDVVIVKKAFPKIRKRQKARIWKLQHLDKESIYENNIWEGKKKKGNKNEDVDMEDRKQQDMRDFMEEIEEDPEMRSNINLYRVSIIQSG